VLRVNNFRGDRVPDWNDERNPTIKVIKPIIDMLNFEKDDIELFELMLKIYLAQSLNYKDVPEDAKEWVKKVLS